MRGLLSLTTMPKEPVCDESKTTVGKVDNKNCIVMMYDVNM